LVGAAGPWAAEDQQGLLEKVREFADLGDMIPAMASALAREVPECLEEIERRLRADDRAGVVFLAHRLAGSAGTVGARSLERAARELEQTMRREPGDGVPSLQALRTAVGSLLSLVASETFAELPGSAAAPAT
jgi:HPt (histidine-containing phosphotransfer) domain-containing protein